MRIETEQRKEVVPVVPPWMNDPEPDTWVPLGVAARLYFRKSAKYVYEMLTDGTLKEAGFGIYQFDKRWYIKLPCAISPKQYPRRADFKG